MHWAIVDTSVYIDHWQGHLPVAALEPIRQAFIVRQSAVVLSELRRGARTPAARKLVETLNRLAPVRWEPIAEDWWHAGELVRVIGDRHNWDTAKRRAFQNDALIALTARRHGAAVVTTNRGDFELLSARLRIRVVVPSRDSV